MKTFQWLGLVLLALPVVEIFVLVKMTGLLGFVPTLALLLIAGALGSVLMHQQGTSNWMQLRTAFVRGELPAEQLLESSLIALGALLLVIPGFVTDILALFCLLPQTRRALARRALKAAPQFRGMQNPPEDARVIEGEFKRDS